MKTLGSDFEFRVGFDPTERQFAAIFRIERVWDLQASTVGRAAASLESATLSCSFIATVTLDIVSTQQS